MSAGRVLIVDDEPQIRRVLRMALTDHSYEVEDARSGEEAMEKISGEKFDLILLDMNMPGMGGIATCRAMRDKIDAVIIMVTVRNTEVEKVACLDAGADTIKTSTGKIGISATLPISLVMCQSIHSFYHRTGIRRGFKAAGGILHR